MPSKIMSLMLDHAQKYYNREADCQVGTYHFKGESMSPEQPKHPQPEDEKDAEEKKQQDPSKPHDPNKPQPHQPGQQVPGSGSGTGGYQPGR